MTGAFDAVIFDMDGVIFDSERKVMECWMEIAEKYGIPGMEEPLRLCLGVTRARSREIMQARYGADTRLWPLEVQMAATPRRRRSPRMAG